MTDSYTISTVTRLLSIGTYDTLIVADASTRSVVDTIELFQLIAGYVTPDCRVYEVPEEDRTYTVPAENRTVEVTCG